MSSIVVTFLIVLHFTAQAYAPAVNHSAAPTKPKSVQPPAGWWWFKKKGVKPAAQSGPKPKSEHNYSQAIYGQPSQFLAKAVSKKRVAKPLAAQPPVVQSSAAQPEAALTMPENLSEYAKKFYKEHASLLTPGVSKSDFKHLSTGEDGSVHIVRRIKDNAKFALKEIELTEETKFSELAEQIDIQVQATKDKRTHINNVFDVFLDKNKIYMVLELMKGDVEDEIFDAYPMIKLTEKEFCRMAKGMMEDLVYLEERGISHRNLDTFSLFVNEKNEIVIGDFQQATKEREFSCIYHAWDDYAPPEWKRTDRKCTIKVDVWAIGVFFKNIQYHITDVSDAFAKMTSPNTVLSAEPARRPSFSEMLSFPLFEQC